MAVTYKKLWHILIDRDMKKKDLEQLAGITHYQMCKLANDKDVTTDVIGAICTALNVRSDEIMDFMKRQKTRSSHLCDPGGWGFPQQLHSRFFRKMDIYALLAK